MSLKGNNQFRGLPARLHQVSRRDLLSYIKAADRYHHFVRWSEEDQLYIGYCPDLYVGGVCHGVNDEQVYAELCRILRDEVAHRQEQGEALPTPTVRVTRDVELASV